MLDWVEPVTLMPTLGSVLQSLCLLPKHTRYHCRGLLSRMVPACGLCGGTLAAAGLAALLLYLAGDPLAKDADTWKLLVLTSMFYALLKSIVRPDRDGSIEWFRFTHLTSGASWSHRSRMLSHKLEDEDDSIRFYGNLPDHEMDMAGVQGRDYKSTASTECFTRTAQ